MMRRAALLLPLIVAACVAPPKPPPPAPPPAPVAPPEPEPETADRPLTPGVWTYTRDAGGSVASFGPSGEFTMRCDMAARTITLGRLGATGASMTVATSYAPATWPAGMAGGRVSVVLRATDPSLDRMAFSRGRFRVAVPGLPELILPAWAEPSRVIEDCRS